MKKQENFMKEEGLQLGKYNSEELVQLTEEDVDGGGTPTATVSLVLTWISDKTCPTTACTRDC